MIDNQTQQDFITFITKLVNENYKFYSPDFGEYVLYPFSGWIHIDLKWIDSGTLFINNEGWELKGLDHLSFDENTNTFRIKALGFKWDTFIEYDFTVTAYK